MCIRDSPWAALIPHALFVVARGGIEPPTSSRRFGTRIRQRSRPPFTVGLLPRGRVLPHTAGTERALVADAMPGALAHPLRQAGCRVTDGPGDGFVDVA